MKRPHRRLDGILNVAALPEFGAFGGGMAAVHRSLDRKRQDAPVAGVVYGLQSPGKLQ